MLVFRRYTHPREVRWLGWIETHDGCCVGFIRLDGRVVFDWDSGFSGSNSSGN